MKTALLVVSFGTTHLDTFQETIVKTEACIADAFPELPLYRAFTSRIVRSRLKSKYDIIVDDVETALARIKADGFSHVVIQPTLLIPGEEYDRLCASVRAAADGLTVSIGRPLLCDDHDLDGMISLLRESYPVNSDTVLLLMGHGTEHKANDIYEQLIVKMREQTGSAMRLCTVEGTPSFDDAIAELTYLPCKQVKVAPLLFVAGDHAKNDMSGDEPDSLRSRLAAEGFTVECVLQGLGQLPAVQQLYVRKTAEAVRSL